MIRPFLFLLAVMTMTLVLAAVPLGALIWIHRNTHRTSALAIWGVATLVWAAAAATALTQFLYSSGLIAWVEAS